MSHRGEEVKANHLLDLHGLHLIIVSDQKADCILQRKGEEAIDSAIYELGKMLVSLCQGCWGRHQ